MCPAESRMSACTCDEDENPHRKDVMHVLLLRLAHPPNYRAPLQNLGKMPLRDEHCKDVLINHSIALTT